MAWLYFRFLLNISRTFWHLACSTPARAHTHTLHPNESPMSCAMTPATKEWLTITPNACIILHKQVADITLEYELPQNRSVWSPWVKQSITNKYHSVTLNMLLGTSNYSCLISLHKQVNCQTFLLKSWLSINSIKHLLFADLTSAMAAHMHDT
jgi:hypothetical protein